jgi:hypothetical protein
VPAITPEIIGSCPVCNKEMEVTHLHCHNCGTSIEGQFDICRFCRLTTEETQFLETFIKCKGNIKEVEKELDISYPTVKRKLNQAINSLGYNLDSTKEDKRGEKRKEVLNKLERGEISSEEAVELLSEF